MFAPEIYRSRRLVLRENMGSGLLVFMGHVDAPRTYADNAYPFRQDSSFLYYFGHAQPHLAGVIDADTGHEWLFGPNPTMDETIWTGPRPGIQELAERVGVQRGQDMAVLGVLLERAHHKGTPIHFLPPYREEMRLALHRLLGTGCEPVALKASRPLINAVIAQRSLKSEWEIAEIEAALEISAAMYGHAFASARPGRREQEIAGMIEGEVLTRGSRLSFQSIVTVHGEVLHNHLADQILKKGDLLLIDSGAESSNGYASDITRTLPVGGQFSSVQRDIYSIVLAAQQEAIRMLRPGVMFKDVHLAAARVMVTGLCNMGIMRGDVDEAVACGAHALFFVHGLGHMLGLDVHDMESFGEDRVGYDASVTRSPQFGLHALRLAREVVPGFVVTVEPGLYFIPGLIESWRRQGRCTAYINYDVLASMLPLGGIRIEDDVQIMATGARVLGPSIPKTVSEIEACMA
ncbi:MAG: aminopeptidase P family protein [Desulfoplanes sp.]